MCHEKWWNKLVRRNKYNNKRKRFRNYVQLVVFVCTNIKHVQRFSILFHRLSKYLIFFRNILQTLSILNININYQFNIHFVISLFSNGSLNLLWKIKRTLWTNAMTDYILILKWFYFIIYTSVYNEIPYLIEFDDKLLCKFYNKYNSLEIYYYL